jgi:acetolactate synthase small subunit
LILQAYGASEKLDAFIDLLRPFNLVELVRSGKLLMARGKHIT